MNWCKGKHFGARPSPYPGPLLSWERPSRQTSFSLLRKEAVHSSREAKSDDSRHVICLFTCWTLSALAKVTNLSRKRPTRPPVVNVVLPLNLANFNLTPSIVVVWKLLSRSCKCLWSGVRVQIGIHRVLGDFEGQLRASPIQPLYTKGNTVAYYTQYQQHVLLYGYALRTCCLHFCKHEEEEDFQLHVFALAVRTYYKRSSQEICSHFDPEFIRVCSYKMNHYCLPIWPLALWIGPISVFEEHKV